MCVLIRMEAIVHPRYFKNTEIVQPGLVGSVGDALLSVKLKHSAPDLPLRFDPVFSGEEESRVGSYVQDGMDGGGQPRVHDSNWQSGRSFKVANGWYYQDLRVPDRRFEPQTGE